MDQTCDLCKVHFIVLSEYGPAEFCPYCGMALAADHEQQPEQQIEQPKEK